MSLSVFSMNRFTVELRHRMSSVFELKKSYLGRGWGAQRSEHVVQRRQKNAHISALLALHFLFLCVPPPAKCRWKYRQIQSAILIPLCCPSHGHSIYPDLRLSTFSLTYRYTHTIIHFLQHSSGLRKKSRLSEGRNSVGGVY